MSKKIKISANFNGQTFTRTTARTYTHVVIAKSSFKKDLNQAFGWAKLRGEDHVEFFLTRGFEQYDANKSEAEKAENERIFNLTTEEYAQEELNRRIEDSFSSKYSEHGEVAWCGRLDLAQKQASDAIKNGLLDVQIIPVNA
jgi:hypothetical protein